MKIENLRSEINGNRARVSEIISWEDNDRPAVEVYFETDEEFGNDLTQSPRFLKKLCLLPSWEKRI
jgi:hypothetical protein